MNHRDEVHGEFLEAGAQAAAFLEPTDALLDGAAAPVELLVEAVAPVVGMLVATPRDHDTDRVLMEPGADAPIAVTFVSGDRRGPCTRRSNGLADANPAHDFFELRAFVDLSGRDVDGEGKSVTFSNQVEVAAESAARVAQSVVFGFFGAPFFPPPAAAREARTVDPSTHHRSPSMRPSASSRYCNASRIRSNTWARRQELKW